MKTGIMLFIGLLLGVMALGQEITIEKKWGGRQFFQEGKRLTMSEMVKTMESNDEAFREITKARTNNTIGMVLGGAGGFMVGYPLGAAVAGGDPNWVMAGIGAGLIAVSIPISLKFNKQAETAVDLYNKGLETNSRIPRPEFYFGCTENGVGLRLCF